MNQPNIDTRIEQLNLEWQEYDFGDTLYAKIPIALLSEKTSINNNCETQKYKIELQPDGDAYIFKEIEQKSLLTKTFTMISHINTALDKEEADNEAEKQPAEY